MKRYHTDGMRLTDCCGAPSTYPMDANGALCCKKCYREVTVGEGDGMEYEDGREITDGSIEIDLTRVEGKTMIVTCNLCGERFVGTDEHHTEVLFSAHECPHVVDLSKRELLDQLVESGGCSQAFYDREVAKLEK